MPISFDVEDLQAITNIIIEKQNDNIVSNFGFGKSVINIDGDETRLYIKNFKKDFILSYITLKYSRKGTLTELLPIFKDICRKHNLNRIVIENVLTEDMKSFCEKFGFTRISQSKSDILEALPTFALNID